MEEAKKKVTLEDVYKELEEVREQNKAINAKLESMQESNVTFHTGFATIFEALQYVNEVKQNEDCVDMLKIGSFANLLCADQWKEKHMRTAKENKSKVKKRVVVAKKLDEEKAQDIIDFIKRLKSI